MMSVKKLLALLILSIMFIFLNGNTSLAMFEQEVLVKSVNFFSLSQVPKEFSVSVVEEVLLDNGILLESNSIVQGIIINVENAKRAKRDANFLMMVTSYSIPSSGKIVRLKPWQLVVKSQRYVPQNTFETIGNVSASAVGFFIPGVSECYHFTTGATIKHTPEQSRLKSGIVNVYENSIFSYISEGKELNLKPGQLLYIKIYEEDSKQILKFREKFGYKILSYY